MVVVVDVKPDQDRLPNMHMTNCACLITTNVLVTAFSASSFSTRQIHVIRCHSYGAERVWHQGDIGFDMIVAKVSDRQDKERNC